MGLQICRYMWGDEAMPRKNDETFVTTSIQLERTSLERLEKALVGRRDRFGYRLTKRTVFQFLLDAALKDKASQERLFLQIQEKGQR